MITMTQKPVLRFALKMAYRLLNEQKAMTEQARLEHRLPDLLHSLLEEERYKHEIDEIQGLLEASSARASIR